MTVDKKYRDGEKITYLQKISAFAASSAIKYTKTTGQKFICDLRLPSHKISQNQPNGVGI
jgi:hypothetical protein